MLQSCIYLFWICSILLYYGAPVDVTNSSGRTPLHVAASVGSLASIISLVDHGANINSIDKKGNTPLFYAKTPDTVKLLVMKYEVDITKIGEKGRIVEVWLFYQKNNKKWLWKTLIFNRFSSFVAHEWAQCTLNSR